KRLQRGQRHTNAETSEAGKNAPTSTAPGNPSTGPGASSNKTTRPRARSWSSICSSDDSDHDPRGSGYNKRKGLRLQSDPNRFW
ncbi:unnamed protein product, partial [Amoebophrya sp. A120]